MTCDPLGRGCREAGVNSGGCLSHQGLALQVEGWTLSAASGSLRPCDKSCVHWRRDWIQGDYLSTSAFCSLLPKAVLTAGSHDSEGHIHSFQADIAFEREDHHSTYCNPHALLGPQLAPAVPWGLDQVLKLMDAGSRAWLCLLGEDSWVHPENNVSHRVKGLLGVSSTELSKDSFSNRLIFPLGFYSQT